MDGVVSPLCRAQNTDKGDKSRDNLLLSHCKGYLNFLIFSSIIYTINMCPLISRNDLVCRLEKNLCLKHYRNMSITIKRIA